VQNTSLFPRSETLWEHTAFDALVLHLLRLWITNNTYIYTECPECPFNWILSRNHRSFFPDTYIKTISISICCNVINLHAWWKRDLARFTTKSVSIFNLPKSPTFLKRLWQLNDLRSSINFGNDLLGFWRMFHSLRLVQFSALNIMWTVWFPCTGYP